MLKLLIVDDEKIIREGLQNAIEWNNYGIEVCGAESGGREALEFCRLEMPDIIITDIKMSHMSGLDFIEQIGEIRKDVKIIILSGFDDFEFTKRAMQNQVFEYLLKPVTPDVLTETVVRARDSLLLEREERRRNESYIELMEKNADIICLYYFSGLACGVEYSEEETAAIMSLFKIQFLPEDKFFVMAVDITDTKNMGYYVFLSEFRNDEQFYVISGFDNNYGIFCRADGDAGKIVAEVQQRIKQRCGYDVLIGVSNPFTGICNLKRGWEEAKLSLNYRDITGGSQIIYYNAIDSGFKMLEMNEEKFEADIIDAVDRLDKNSFKPLIETFIADHPELPIDRFRRNICKIILSLCGYIIKIDEKPEKIIGDWRILTAKINSLSEFKVLTEFCVYVFSGIVDKIIDSKSMNSSPVVNEIVEYLHENYNQTFSLETVAHNVHLSPNYVSTLFRRETGKKLSDYVVEVRVEKAKEFLKDPNLRAYEIAEKVGYADSRYFGELFKKMTGVSLTEYRKLI